MNLNELLKIRLAGQQIFGTKLKTPESIVSWMGAMQAQDYAMAKWAIGLRLPGSTDKIIESAINCGEIIRTHIMRPTWHFVTPEDIHWMLDLTAPQIKSSLKSRHNVLELTGTVIDKSIKIIEKILTKNKNLTREEIIKELEKAKIATGNNRASHILLLAELEGLICSGEIKNNKQTYTLLKNRTEKIKNLSREEAIGKLAQKYFLSHGPATLEDFVWWSGLHIKDAKMGLEMIKKDFISETIDNINYLFSGSISYNSIKTNSTYLLPAYDEFIISYKDRNAMLNIGPTKKAISSNGIFRPAIIVNGKVTGIWKRTIKKEEVIVETEFFRKHTIAEKTLIKKESERFGRFLNKKLIISGNKL